MLESLRAECGGVASLQFSPDGSLLAAGYTRGAVLLWAAGNRRPVRALLGHSRSVRCLAFSACADQLASGSAGPDLRVWDISIEQEIARYPTVYPIGALWWSPDGRIIKAADLGGATHRPHIYELELVGPRG